MSRETSLPATDPAWREAAVVLKHALTKAAARRDALEAAAREVFENCKPQEGNSSHNRALERLGELINERPKAQGAKP